MNDQTLLEQIQYTVIEPPDGGQSWPSELWNLDEVLSYANERQDRLVRNTHIIIESDVITVTGPYGTRHPLPADWLATVRVTWTGDSTLNTKELPRSDSFAADHGFPTWPSTAASPKVYMDGDTPVLTIQIAPLPNESGVIGIDYVPSCDALTGNGTELAVANEFAPTVKYGALADMFSKVGRAHDPVRAAYCEQRYQMGTDIANELLRGFTK